MTEKRFILVEYVNKGLFIQDNANDETQYFQGSKASLEKVVDLLNSLANENEQLKSKNRGLQSELQIFKEDATHSNLQINKLADENEQLKQQINELQFNKAKGQQEYQKRVMYD